MPPGIQYLWYSGLAMLPAKRGSRVCSSCGCTNGNRASVCKACHKAFISINRVEGEPLHRNPAKRTSSDVSSLIPPDLQPKPQKLYSVRIRDRGPDYRTYVAVTEDQKWQCHYTSCKTAQDSRLRSVPLGSASSCHTCNHIQWAQQPSINNNHDTCLTLDLAKLPELPFPKKIREELELLFHTSGGNLLQRVSEEMFLVRNAQPTQEHQFGVLHVRFSLKSKKCCKSSSPAHVHLSLFCIQEIFVIDRSCWRWNNTPIVETVHPLLYLSLGVCLQQKLS